MRQIIFLWDAFLVCIAIIGGQSIKPHNIVRCLTIRSSDNKMLVAVRRISSKSQGFTLIETVFALLIFAVAMITAFFLMAGSLRNIQANREHAYVARIMESTIENVRNLSWAELTAQPTSQTFDASKPLVPLFGKAINPYAANESDFDGTYFAPEGSIIIETVPGQPDLRKVTVKVAYASGRGNENAFETMTTLISRNGIDRR